MNYPQQGMTLAEFQRDAVSTIRHSPKDWPGGLVAYHAMGVAEEGGEVVGRVKKTLREGIYHPELSLTHRNKIMAEMGDVLWYLAALAHDLGTDLEEVAEMNIKKRADRESRGVIKGEGDER